MKYKLCLMLTIIFLVLILGCEKQTFETIEKDSKEVKEIENRVYQQGVESVNLDHIILRAQQERGRNSIQVSEKSEEELINLSKEKDNQDYGHVVKTFFSETLDQEVHALVSIPPLAHPNTYARHVLVQTKESEFYTIYLKKWHKYNGIWTIVHYSKFTDETGDYYDHFEVIEGIPSVRSHDKKDWVLADQKLPNFRILKISEAPEPVRNWANQLISYDDWRFEFFHFINEEASTGDTYVMLTAPSEPSLSLEVDSVYVGSNGGEINIYYNHIDERGYENYGTKDYFLFHFKDKITYEIAGWRDATINEMPECNAQVKPEKPCPSN